MKIQALYDLQQEINRLFIAGSKFAAGDPRLLKQVPVFNKMGEKAPVFKKLAADIEELTKTGSQQSSEKLLAISTLLYSILYTQGETTEEGAAVDRTPLLQLDKIDTKNSYLQLKPVIEALSSSNQGRMEVLRDAFERKVFEDFRTYKHLEKALGDKYSELADYVADTIIPSLGKPIIPFLVSSFAYEDKSDQVRRFRILRNAHYEGLQEMTDKILAENLPKLQAEAIIWLGTDGKNQELVMKLSDDKNKLVREAAYKALAAYNTKESLEKLKNLYIKGKHTEAVVDAIANSPLPYFYDEVISHFHLAVTNLQSLDKDVDAKIAVAAVDRIALELNLFKNKDKKEAYDTFETILLDKKIGDLLKAKKSVLSYAPGNITDTIINCLHTFDKTKVLEFLNNIIPKLSNAEWQHQIYRQYLYYCTVGKYSKEKLFDLFIEPYKKGYININDLHYQVFGNKYNYYEEINKADTSVLDDRWIPILYQVAEKSIGKDKWYYEGRTALALLDAYEPKNSEKFNKLLLDILSKHNAQEIDFIFEMIVRRQLPNAFELIFECLSKIKKSTYYYSYYARSAFWKQFPKEYAQKLRDLYEKNNINIFLEIADTIEY